MPSPEPSVRVLACESFGGTRQRRENSNASLTSSKGFAQEDGGMKEVSTESTDYAPQEVV